MRNTPNPTKETKGRWRIPAVVQRGTAAKGGPKWPHYSMPPKLISKIRGPAGAIRIALRVRCMLHSEQPMSASGIFTVVVVILHVWRTCSPIDDPIHDCMYTAAVQQNDIPVTDLVRFIIYTRRVVVVGWQESQLPWYGLGLGSDPLSPVFYHRLVLGDENGNKFSFLENVWF